MSKVLGMLVALAIFVAVPGVALGQVSSGNEQDANIGQNAEAGSGGNAGNQAAIVQQNAGRDANATVNQSQNFQSGGAGVSGRGGGVVTGRFGGDFDRGHVRARDVGGGVVHERGVGVTRGVGGGVGGVTLARTGFDAWLLALLGGVALAGGIGILAAQRHGRLSA